MSWARLFFVFDADVCESFSTALGLHNRAYQELAVQATRAGRKLSCVRPMHHALAELEFDVRSARRNPLRYRCFEDED